MKTVLQGIALCALMLVCLWVYFHQTAPRILREQGCEVSDTTDLISNAYCNGVRSALGLR